MQEELVRALRAQRAETRARWETLLRIERVNTPLANPDALVFMIDWTLDEAFNELQHPHIRRRGPRAVDGTTARASCPCGRNPLLAYFAAGEQALEETLILEQARVTPVDPVQRDTAFCELKTTVRDIARREIEAFCAVCQYRHESHACATPEVAKAPAPG
jgi:hypothetical protein